MVNAAVTLGIDPAGGHPERRLAFGYAPVAARPGIAALFALDATLAHVTRGTRDPLVAQMRLTWWYEALTRLDGASPPAQPVLRALADGVLTRGITGAELAAIVEGWEALLDEGDVAERHARARGGRLFAVAARVLGARADPVSVAGEGWALADLASTTPDAAVAARARMLAKSRLDMAKGTRWPANGRALGALAHIARMDLAGSAPGSPRRVARLLMHRLTGR